MESSTGTASPSLATATAAESVSAFIRSGPGALRRRSFIQSICFWVFRLAAAVNGLALVVIVYFMAANGLQAITWDFLTQPPSDSMTRGGILPCIVGTIALFGNSALQGYRMRFLCQRIPSL